MPLLRILLAPFTGLTWIAGQIQSRVDAELDDRENLQKQLLSLQLAFDMGDISEEDFEEQENDLLEKIQAMADAEAAAQAEEEAE